MMMNGKRGSFGPSQNQNASLLLEKAKSNIRRSTPDSEALASSDDEQDHVQRPITSSSQQTPRSNNRRPSWFSDTRPPVVRKGSGTALESLSSNSPHSSTDASTWSTATSAGTRGHGGSASLPWNNAIWGHDQQKGLPARFSEVLPSPTAMNHSSLGIDPPVQSPSPRRDSMTEGAIPFAIPLHPTLKSYRSQSYSVGQSDSDSQAQNPSRSAQQGFASRARAGSSYAGLHHRPSRPSILGGEFTAEAPGLDQVREVEDDEENIVHNDVGNSLANSQARTIEQLAMENALLRQQALAHHTVNAQSSLSYGINPSTFPRSHRGMQISESVLEESDDNLGNEGSLTASRQHRFSGSQEALHSASPEQLVDIASGNRSPASFKRGHWHSSLGFGGLAEQSQSRRHSFADMPLRSMPNNMMHEAVSKQAELQQNSAGYGNLNAAVTQPDNVNYFTNPYSKYPEIRNPPGNNMAAMSQHRMPYFGHQQMHQPQSLYLVTFKAARAEFYYVQEGTGLEVNEGDLVIVEADRGTDLGTVAHKNVDWSVAKDLKEQYVAEHYNWLMMFSRQGQNGGMTSGAVRPSSSGAPTHKTSVGSNLGSQGSASDNMAAEIKPKMIKRLAQQHEIHTLREKEGNEAKAKRMCQQKVVEHHLNMEILDAEFQMDWKKLTFYYFADSYINFNSLVTDLFKIYKTRIWMSAINPASFVSPAASLTAHLGPGFGAIGVDREQQFNDQMHAKNGHFAATTQEETFDSNWQGVSNMQSTPPAGYGQQFWPGHAFQMPSSANGMRNPGQPRDGSSPSSRVASRDVSSRSQGHYADSLLHSNTYMDPVQTLRGLSLNSP